MTTMDARTTEIMRLYELGLSKAKIGRRVNLSRQRIHQIIQREVNKSK